MAVSSGVEVDLGDDRVVVVQRFGDVLTISTARRVKRTLTTSLVMGGTVLLPVGSLPEIFRAVRAAAQDYGAAKATTSPK